MPYIWQNSDWPQFTWNQDKFDGKLAEFEQLALLTDNLLNQLQKKVREQTAIELLASEALHTSLIEGEKFDIQDLRDKCGEALKHAQSDAGTRDANGDVVSLVFQARYDFNLTLTSERLCKWQEMAIAKTSAFHKVERGKCRTHAEPMQIVSGAIGMETVHYEAPPSSAVPGEMERFLDWFNGSTALPGILRAGIAHFYFECIHPFEDGNGRVGRAISDLALSQALGRPVLMSLSKTIFERRNSYYDALSQSQSSSLDLTDWLNWFADAAVSAQKDAIELMQFLAGKELFWEKYEGRFNDRQVTILERMLKEGPQGFQGGMSAKKYAKLAICSYELAQADLAYLMDVGAMHHCMDEGRPDRFEITLPSLDSE
ncbi:Fic family protein [Aestuariispira insulae]|uniref:Fic family protein n=1 Tax=Aestuariispira insulae TaxID=1461337 RepID=A0A3D9HQ29_9PROT|nr:DUF4172 domain-containing protein [Aestuariispira insulae]RED51624.1 Fic family protein [Aestuariispira insulae]